MVKKLPSALGHLLAFHLQEAVVHPHLGQRMAVMGAFALGDLVFVMRETPGRCRRHECRRSRPDICPPWREHSICQPGRPRPQGESQPGSACVRRLPQHEIHRVLLVGRHFHPRAGDHLVQRAARQLAVIGLGGNIEQHMAFRRIGMAGGDQLFDHGDHLGDMLGGARRHGRRQIAQRRHIFVIDARGLFGQFADGDAALGGARVDLVVHVGDVADIGDMARRHRYGAAAGTARRTR